MDIMLTGKNIEISNKIKDYVDRKLGKLSRFLSNISESKVEITEEGTKSPEQRFVVQVTISVNGTILRGEERGQDIFMAIDKVSDVMDNQIKRFKGKRYNKARGTSFAKGTSDSTGEAELPADLTDGRIIKTKRFIIKPMSPEEAVENMELLAHDFFLFYNDTTNKINLVYRRKGGDYGLIEPQVG
ncbi:ribosome hibernation-promoting factor, HPF/YfiA family [Chloroflexota bacterium]